MITPRERWLMTHGFMLGYTRAHFDMSEGCLNLDCRFDHALAAEYVEDYLSETDKDATVELVLEKDAPPASNYEALEETMRTLKLGKLIYCNTRIRHDLVIFDEPARHIVWRFWWSY